ncbi:MAG TPA: DUF2950 domain-containing protein [Candidatus Polarisedimenticolaceae bacterium]|nr:DUF2950 domain-containing protein [Candidatus Polarisedimenticolaceae bacterium]
MIATFALTTILAATPATTPAPTVAPKTFATPEAAVDALLAAAEKWDVPALKEILGSDGVDLVVTEDPVQDKNQSAAFATKAREKKRVSRSKSDPAKATLIIGSEDWPMPVPIVQKGGRWSFDTKAGRQEVLYRRIGRNELDAIEICRGYVEAQHEYASEKHDGAKINQYAQRIISTKGKQDGLAWQASDGSWHGPVGEAVARAIAEGYETTSPPYHGYYFKVLKAQGASAPLGAMDYVVKGAMLGGFALAATPAEYEITGIKSFIVGYDGVVYEKDLGPDSVQKFRSMTLYDPDKSWSKVK